MTDYESDFLATAEREAEQRLRDQFAMAALTGLTASLSEDQRTDVLNGINGGRLVSAAAYKYADAMMKARPNPAKEG